MSSGGIDCGNGVRLERALRCPMSDGIELVSDHYYPPAGGANPTLLMRQPYGRDIASTVTYAHPAWFASHGYNVVIQDVRGRGDSGGVFYPFRQEANDGADTIAWLRERPESNGRIGMYGFSYQGITQLLAASKRPEGLAAIAPGMTAHDLYHGWFYHQGALRFASALFWGIQLLKADACRLKLTEASDCLERAWSSLASQTSFVPFLEHPAISARELPSYVRDWFEHAEPSDYWSELDITGSVDQISVPALHISGWYDTYVKGSIDGFLALSQGGADERARQHQYLVAGPWVHIPWGDRVGAAELSADSLLDTDGLLVRWFNHWLKDSGEFSGEPRIRHFVLGENRWREAGGFPGESSQVFYLHSAGRANSRKGDGVLRGERPDEGEPADIFIYDPEVPVLAPGGGASPSGQFDQALLELGNNLLVYSTSTLGAPIRVLGSPRVSLYCASSAGHTDLCAKLVRIRPGGRAEFISIGIARSSWLFRNSIYLPDTIQHWQFELEPTSCLFAPGEQIGLEVSSSAFPLYDRNPGSAVPSCRATSWDWRRSTQIVFHNRAHPSALNLPLDSAEAAR